MRLSLSLSIAAMLVGGAALTLGAEAPAAIELRLAEPADSFFAFDSESAFGLIDVARGIEYPVTARERPADFELDEANPIDLLILGNSRIRARSATENAKPIEPPPSGLEPPIERPVPSAGKG